MRKQTVILTVSLFLIIGCLLAACSAEHANSSIFPSDTRSETVSENGEAIKELEIKILELEQKQQFSDTEYQKELEALRKQLSALKGQQSFTEDSSDSTEELPPPSIARFLYSTDGTTATITGYTGTDEHIIIPKAIDGYDISAIAENAFSSKTLRSVIITNGISKIDWFAFEGCSALQSVTIPTSVNSIGYDAFSEVSPSFTIYCHSGSFAQSYAQSYGFSYAII